MTQIKKIEIAVFGKFRDFEMEFDKGYNEFILENEFGKSTITDFILFMLYALPKKQPKDKTLASHLLKKYMPWDSDGKISGAMELLADGKLYRIERFQRETGSGKATVRDALSGAEVDISDSPGMHFFKVDYDTFLRTFALRQNDMNFYKTDGIENALKNLVTTGDESVSFDTAVAALRKKKTKYQHTGRTGGLIYSLPKEISLIDEQSFMLTRELSDISDRLGDANDISQKLESAEAKQKELEQKQQYAAACDAARTLKNVKEAEEEIQVLKRKLSIADGKKTTEELKTAQAAFDVLSVLEKKSESSKNRAEALKLEYQNIVDSCKNYQLIKDNKQEVKNLCAAKNKINSVLVFVGLFVIILAMACAIVLKQSPVVFFTSIGIAVLGIVVLLLGFILKVKVKIPQKYGVNQAGLRALYDEFCKAQDKLDALHPTLTQAMQESDEDFNALTDAKAHCEAFGFKDRNEISEAMALKQSSEIINFQIEKSERQKAELLGGNTIQQITELARGGDVGGPTENDIQKQMTFLSMEKQQLMKTAVELSDCVKEKEELGRKLTANMAEKEKLKKELAEAVYTNDVLTLAIDALCEAYDKINSIYSPILSEKAEAPLKAFTCGKYKKLFLDKNFEIRLQSETETKELGYFSKGTQEAVYFALRNAVGEIIAGKDGLLLVLDDPFWALDDARVQKAREYLKILAKDKQIIVFSAR